MFELTKDEWAEVLRCKIFTANSFSKSRYLRQDMQYDRFRRRGLDKVHVKMCLTLVGHLLRKLFAFYYGRAKFDYWIAPPDLSDEMMPEVDAKSFKKTVRKKDINESLRIEHKKKKKVS